jgi:hypothetical protein
VAARPSEACHIINDNYLYNKLPTSNYTAYNISLNVQTIKRGYVYEDNDRNRSVFFNEAEENYALTRVKLL